MRACPSNRSYNSAIWFGRHLPGLHHPARRPSSADATAPKRTCRSAPTPTSAIVVEPAPSPGAASRPPPLIALLPPAPPPRAARRRALISAGLRLRLPPAAPPAAPPPPPRVCPYPPPGPVGSGGSFLMLTSNRLGVVRCRIFLLRCPVALCAVPRPLARLIFDVRTMYVHGILLP